MFARTEFFKTEFHCSFKKGVQTLSQGLLVSSYKITYSTCDPFGLSSSKSSPISSASFSVNHLACKLLWKLQLRVRP